MSRIEQLRLELAGNRLQAYAAVSLAGKESLLVLEPEIRALLEHDDSELRGEAIRTLGMRWQTPNFATHCVAYAGDPAEHLDVRMAATQSVGAYFLGSLDADVLSVLHAILKNANEPQELRGFALRAVSHVMSSSPFESRKLIPYAVTLKVEEATTPEQASAAIPWGVLDVRPDHR